MKNNECCVNKKRVHNQTSYAHFPVNKNRCKNQEN